MKMRFGSSAETASVCKSNARACAGPGDFAGGVQKTPVVWRGVSHEAAPSSARLFSCRPPVAPQMVRIPGVNSGASSDRFSVQVSARWRTDSMSRVASVYAAFITFWHIGAQRRRNDLGDLKLSRKGRVGSIPTLRTACQRIGISLPGQASFRGGLPTISDSNKEPPQL